MLLFSFAEDLQYLSISYDQRLVPTIYWSFMFKTWEVCFEFEPAKCFLTVLFYWMIIALYLSHSFNANVNIWNVFCFECIYMQCCWFVYSLCYLCISWPLMHNIKQQNERCVWLHIGDNSIGVYHGSGISDICSILHQLSS